MLRQSEKLATLGKLSAGMAHELNNPAAAAQRGAAQMAETISALQQTHLKLGEMQLTAGQLESSWIWISRHRRGQTSPDLDVLTRSDRESDLEDWLGEQGIQDAWKIVPTW